MEGGKLVGSNQAGKQTPQLTSSGQDVLWTGQWGLLINPLWFVYCEGIGGLLLIEEQCENTGREGQEQRFLIRKVV